jgi:hypothetical protein
MYAELPLIDDTDTSGVCEACKMLADRLSPARIPSNDDEVVIKNLSRGQYDEEWLCWMRRKRNGKELEE